MGTSSPHLDICKYLHSGTPFPECSLRREFMKVFYIVNKDQKTMDGCVYYRNHLPALYLTASGKADCKITNQFKSRSQENKKTRSIDVLWDVSNIVDSDIVVFSRLYQITDFPMVKAFVDAAKHYGKKIVYEVDDNLFDIPLHNLVREPAIQARELILFLMRSADAYTVTTRRLAEYLNNIYPKPTYVLPNSVEFTRPNKVYQSQMPEKKEGIIRIGWTGGGTHIKDLEVAGKAMARLVKKHKNIEFVSLCGEGLDKAVFQFPHIHVGLVPVSIYHDVLEDMDLDIGLCPLIGDKFNSYKSAIKWTEYSMFNAATVYSKVPPYSDFIEDGVTGVGVEKNTKNAWIEAIESILYDVEKRKRIGDNAFDKVYNEYNMQDNTLLWYHAYNEILKNDTSKPDKVL